MKRTDIYIAIIAGLFLLFLGGVAEHTLRWGITCPEAANTPAQHNIDTTPGLPLIVEKVKPRVKPVKAPIIKDTANDTLDTALSDSTPQSGGILLVLEPDKTVVSYKTYKKYENGDSLVFSVSSSILPETPPADWRAQIDRFTAPDTATAPAKRKRAGLGLTLGAGFGSDNIINKNFVPKAQITLGWSIIF